MFGKSDEAKKNRCLMCGKDKYSGKKIIVGIHGGICSECIDLCHGIMEAESDGAVVTDINDGKTVLDRLINLSRQLAYERFVVLGEGNTSAVEGETVWVKASGTTLSSINELGFSRVSMKPVLDTLDSVGLSDEELRQRLNDARVSPERDGAPSTETFMHAWLLGLPDVNYVAHTHPPKTLAAMCDARAHEFSQNRYFPDQIVICGPRSVFIDYIDPGLKLAQEIRKQCKKYTTDTGLQPKTILLKNHGLITVGRSAKEALSATMMMEKAASVFLSARDPVALTKEQIDHIHNWTDEHFRQDKIWED